MIHGTDLPGLAEMDRVEIIGGFDNPAREGLVSLVVTGMSSADVLKRLNEQGITHLRKADHYSGNILDPLGLDGCVRVSMCHYNSEHELPSSWPHENNCSLTRQPYAFVLSVR